MEQWAEIRRLHRAEGVQTKEISRLFGIARSTVRSALAATERPRYQWAKCGSIADDFEPVIRKLLREYPRMPATVIAEGIGKTNSSSSLKNRVALVRAECTSVDPADRLVHEPGHAAQMDLGFLRAAYSRRLRAVNDAASARNGTVLFESVHCADSPQLARTGSDCGNVDLDQ